MKQSTITGILISILCMAFTNKQKIITDYRSAYTGVYFCSRTCYRSYYSKTQDNTPTKDTVSIYVSKDAVDSVLQLKMNGQVLKLKLNGRFLGALQNGRYGGKFFAADSLDFRYAVSRASSCTYVGKKK